MPTDASTYRGPTPAPAIEPEHDRALPAGAGLAIGVMLGAAIWAGLIALYVLL